MTMMMSLKCLDYNYDTFLSDDGKEDDDDDNTFLFRL
jgi:hypothetical protein